MKQIILIPSYSLSILFTPTSTPFITLLSFLLPLTVLHSVKYLTRYGKLATLRFYPILSVLALTTYLFFTTNNVILFVVLLEIITVTSCILVAYGMKREEITASITYLTFSVITTKFLIGGLAILVSLTGSYVLLENLKLLSKISSENTFLGLAIVTLLLIPFLMKAAVPPLHFWLPNVYAEAPSSFSALLSGVLSKIGIYGLILVLTNTVTTTLICQVWGSILVVLGIIGILIGSLQMLLMEDYKKLIAYSSIEHIGYIVLCLGIWLLTFHVDPLVSALAFTTAIVHVINHGITKALLFLNSGSILYTTGTRDLGSIGGLSRYMPYTCVAAIIGVLTMAGLPLFAVFLSKWLVYTTCLLAGEVYSVLYVSCILALIGSLLSAIAYSKYLTEAFFTTPSEIVLQRGIREVPKSMIIPQMILALACVALGLYPYPYVSTLYRVTRLLVPEYPSFTEVFTVPTLPVVVLPKGLGSTWLPLIVGLTLAIGCVVGFTLKGVSLGVRKLVPLWLSGEVISLDYVRYKSYGVYSTIRPTVWKYVRALTKIEALQNLRKIAYGRVYEVYLGRVYEGITYLVIRFASITRRSMLGELCTYLAVIFLFLTIVLTVMVT